MRPSPHPLHLPTAGKSCQQQSTSIMGRISGRWGCVSPTGWVNPQSKNLCEPTTRKKPLVLGLQSPQRLRASGLSNRKPTCSGEWPAGLHRRQQMAGQTATSRMREHGCLSENPGVRRAHLVTSSTNIGEGARREKPVGYARLQDLHGTCALQEYIQLITYPDSPVTTSSGMPGSGIPFPELGDR